MPETVVFISGVTQGIGKSLVQAYLQRPHHTVIGSIRNSNSPGVADLKASPKAEGSKLQLVHIESASAEDPKNALAEIEAAGIEHIDIVIANAGGSPPVVPLDGVSREDMVSAFQVNVLGPLSLYQTFKPLLKKSTNPKWVSVSTVASSITLMESMGTYITPAYGASKASLNWVTAGINHSNADWLTTLLLHPGLVQTVPGNWVARHVGQEKAPITIEHSVSQLMSHIDQATRGNPYQLVDAIKGGQIPW